MSVKKYFKNTYAVVSFKYEGFKKDLKGVAAVEFAILAPLMLLMYVGTIEVSAAISANRKISRAASTIGDIVAQFQGCVDDATLQDLVNIADSIIDPYSQPYSVSVTSVKIEANGDTSVRGTRTFNGPGINASQPYNLPSQITQNEGFIIAARIRMLYTPIVGWANYDNNATFDIDRTTAIQMEEELYLRPRVGQEVTFAANCP